MCHAEIEWVTPRWLWIIFGHRVGVLRAWDKHVEPGLVNKNPYAWVCTVVHTSKRELEFKGVVEAPSPFLFRNIVRELKSHGYRTGWWVRIDPITKEERSIKFSPRYK